MAASLLFDFTSKDLRKNPGATVALTAMLVVSAFVMVAGLVVMERLAGSIDRFFATAAPPHFLQMHSGEYSPDALEDFASAHPEIESWLVEDMLGYEGEQLSWSRPGTAAGGDLSTSLIDNLFVTQNEDFDLLLDPDDVVVHPDPGEIHVPIAYRETYDLRVGDMMYVDPSPGSTGPAGRELDLRIAGFVRDAQFASSLSSATRFLVSPEDFTALESAGGGDPEIIAEYRLSDPAGAGAFATAYASDPDVPKNGQPVTYRLLQMAHGLGDGLVAGALVLIGAVLLLLALVNVRFAIRTTVSTEIRQIGALRAIGLPGRSITALYLGKYGVMATAGALLGAVLAFLVTPALTASITTTYGAGPLTLRTFLVPVASVLVLVSFVLLLCAAAFRRAMRTSVVGAMVRGSTATQKQEARLARRRARRGRGTPRAGRSVPARPGLDVRLALHDLRTDRRAWTLVPLVFALTVVAMAVPLNLYSTFTDPRFMTHLGTARSDVLVDVHFHEDPDGLAAQIGSSLAADDRVRETTAYATQLFDVTGEEGEETIPVAVGEFPEASIDMIDGVLPESGQIALSVLNAEKFGLDTGDTLALRRDGTDTSAVVSGIYQDVTAGGLTAKLAGEPEGPAVSHSFFVDLAPGVDPERVAEEYGSEFPEAEVLPMEEYSAQTLSFITAGLSRATLVAAVGCLGIVALVVGFFLRVRLGQEDARRSALRTVGFSWARLGRLVSLKTMICAGLGIVLGVVCVGLFSSTVLSAVMAASGIGIVDLTVRPAPWLMFVLLPLVLLCLAWTVASLIARTLPRLGTGRTTS